MKEARMSCSPVPWLTVIVPLLLAADSKRPTPPPDSDIAPGLRAEIYDDSKFEHKVKGRFDPTIDFDFGSRTPDPAIKKGHKYSIRWFGWLKVPKTDDYDLGFEVNGGCMLYVDDALLIDYGAGGKTDDVQKKIHLEQGLHQIRVEYLNKFGAGRVRFKWKRESKMHVVPAEALFHQKSPSE
jgi:hypothetical protein